MKFFLSITRLLFSLTFCMALVSCSSSGSSSENENGNGNNAVSAFQGVYAGEYTGTETGSWNISIDANGKVIGNADTVVLSTTSISLNGFIDETGSSTLISGTARDDTTFIINIADGVVTGSWTDTTGGGTINGALVVDSNVSGAFSVGVELVNYTFTPLKILDFTASIFTFSINNDRDPVNPPFYNAHGLAVIINPTNNTVVAISYAYFNTGSEGSVVTGDFVYLRNCELNPCSSVRLDLSARTLSFANTSLPVDTSLEIANRPGVTNLATIPALINGDINW